MAFTTVPTALSLHVRSERICSTPSNLSLQHTVPCKATKAMPCQEGRAPEPSGFCPSNPPDGGWGLAAGTHCTPADRPGIHKAPRVSHEVLSAFASPPSREKPLRIPGTGGTAGRAGTVPFPLPLRLSHVGVPGSAGMVCPALQLGHCPPIPTGQRKSQRPHGLGLLIWEGGGSPWSCFEDQGLGSCFQLQLECQVGVGEVRSLFSVLPSQVKLPLQAEGC